MEIYFITIFWFLICGLIWERNFNFRRLMLIFNVVVFTIIYGFRYQVGVDWYNYINVYFRQVEHPFKLDTLEIGYKALNVLGYISGAEILVPLVMSSFFMFYFTFKSCQKLDINPYYFFSIVAPFHLVMSGVNYTRQAIALSLFIYAYSQLLENNKKKYFIFIAFAGLFHTSALSFLPLVAINAKKRYLFLISILVLPSSVFFMFDEYQQYFNSSMDSAGVYLRALFLIGPIFFLLCYFKEILKTTKLNFRLSLLMIMSFPFIISLTFLSTTIADRFSYYFILMSLMTWMHINKEMKIKEELKLKSHGLNLPLRNVSMQLIFMVSMLAFGVWIFYSKYNAEYTFNSYFNLWF